MIDYRDYINWKEWDKSFSYSQSEKEYYSTEFSKFLVSGKKIIEIGFGNGSYLAWAKDQGAHVIGIEIQPQLVYEARAAGFDAAMSLDILLPENQNNIDTIVAIDVFEHLNSDEIRKTFSTIAKLLKKDGSLILRVPNGQSPFFGRIQFGDITHISILTPSKIRQLCMGQGLKLIEARNQARSLNNRSLFIKIGKKFNLLFEI